MERLRNSPDGNSNSEMSNQAPIFKSPESPAYTRSMGPLPPEQEDLIKESSEIQHRINTLSSSAGLPDSYTNQDANKWNTIEAKMIMFQELLNNLQTEPEKILGEENEHPTMGQIIKLKGITLGVSLQYHSLLEEKENLAKKLRFEEKITPQARLSELFVTPELTTRINGINLLDLQKFNPKSSPVVPYYRFLMDARIMSQETEEKTFQENQDPPERSISNDQQIYY